MPATKVRDLTGPDQTGRWGIGGTDLGAPRLSPDGGRIVAVFGDTFEQATVGGPGWRTPTALYGDPASVRAGLRWVGAAGGGYAKQLVPAPHNTVIHGSFVSTQLPTDVITIGNTMYLHVMGCEGLGNVHFTELYRSGDQGETWTSTGTWWPGNHLGGLFQITTFELGDDGFVYCFSTGFQRDKGLILQRVPATRFTDPAAWQPWGWTQAGGWRWGNSPTLVLPGSFGEMCLRRIGSTWLLSGFDAGNYRVDVRALGSPTDDLTRAPVTTVATGCGWGEEDHARGKVAQLYGGFLLPGSTLREQHYVISQWNTSKNWPYRSMQFRLGGGHTQQQMLLN